MRKNRGFTLIELLVVISIISLLSSISLASFQDARVKANNTYTTETIRQYLTAFELVRSNDGQYPSTASIPGEHVCLGAVNCYLDSSGNPSSPPIAERDIGIDAKFLPYLPGLPNVNKKPLFIHGWYRQAIDYTYNPNNLPPNNKPVLWWTMEGLVSSCPFGTFTELPTPGQGTACWITIN